MATNRLLSTSVYVKLLPPLLCTAVILWLLSVGQEVLIPIAFSALMTLLLISPCHFFERQGFPRGIAALITLILAFMVFLVVFYFISRSIVSFRNDLPQMIDSINTSIDDATRWIQKQFKMSTPEIKEAIDSSAASVVPKTSSIVNTAVVTVSGIIFLTTLIFIQTFVFLLYRGLVVKFFNSLLTRVDKTVLDDIFREVRYLVKNYIMGLFIEMVVVAVANSAALYFLGVKYALLLGVIAAVLNIIPYVGIFMGCILTGLITLTTNEPYIALWAVIILIVIHMADTNILMPRIVGSKVKMNAMATITGVFIGSAIWGLAGVFMAVPIMAILKVVFEAIPETRPFTILMGEEEEDSTRASARIFRRRKPSSK